MGKDFISKYKKQYVRTLQVQPCRLSTTWREFDWQLRKPKRRPREQQGNTRQNPKWMIVYFECSC